MEKIKKVLILQIMSMVFMVSFMNTGYCTLNSAQNKQCLRVPMMGFENRERLEEGMNGVKSVRLETVQRLKTFNGFEAFVNLRKARDLFERLKSVVGIRESERFRHAIPLLLAEKEELKNPNEPHKIMDPYYKYPYNCRPGSVHAMRILERFQFKAELRTIEFPKEIYPDLSIHRHSFLVTEIGGKEFIIDIAADQFEPLGENEWVDLGVVVLPVDTVNQYPETFWMYTGRIASANSSIELLKRVTPAAVTRTGI